VCRCWLTVVLVVVASLQGAAAPCVMGKPGQNPEQLTTGSMASVVRLLMPGESHSDCCAHQAPSSAHGTCQGHCLQVAVNVFALLSVGIDVTRGGPVLREAVPLRSEQSGPETRPPILS
jgi:hypothetical protein